MRIIAGKHRGRRIVAPTDALTTRPITDRVKQALFDRLDSAGWIADMVVADVFAGTGSLGLECLSRGAKYVSFVERDRDGLKRLQENIDTLGESDASRVLTLDALGASLVQVLAAKPCDLIFMDPPYAFMHETSQCRRVMQQIERLTEAVTDHALLILRTDEHAPIEPAAGWEGPDTHNHGSMSLHFYTHRR